MESIDKLKIAVNALDSKKAFDIKALEIEDITILADFFVIATGSSTTQVKALADEVDYKMSQAGIEPNHIEGKSSGWILLDYGSLVVHVFYKEDREFYALDRLWQDAKQVDIEDYLVK